MVRGRGGGGLQLPAVLHPHQVPPRAAAGRLLPRDPRPHDPHRDHPPGLRRHLPSLAHCRLNSYLDLATFSSQKRKMEKVAIISMYLQNRDDEKNGRLRYNPIQALFILYQGAFCATWTSWCWFPSGL